MSSNQASTQKNQSTKLIEYRYSEPGFGKISNPVSELNVNTPIQRDPSFSAQAPRYSGRFQTDSLSKAEGAVKQGGIRLPIFQL